MFSFVYGENDGDGDVGVKHEDSEKINVILSKRQWQLRVITPQGVVCSTSIMMMIGINAANDDNDSDDWMKVILVF